MGITDYGHRPVPNVYLTAALSGDPKVGVWNSAHFKNDEYDELVRQYVAALDLDSQRAAAKQIQELLLDETPIVFPYFYNFLSAAKPNLRERSRRRRASSTSRRPASRPDRRCTQAAGASGLRPP